MEMVELISLISTTFLIAYSSADSSSLLGVHPLDEKYYDSGVIKCKDGSKSFTRDRFNDNFCDCSDGTDEPGTSACPTGKFYCRNFGSTPKFLFSSRVNDHICDCCDGSDENDGRMFCPNTCVMGGHVEYTSEQNRIGTGKAGTLNFGAEDDRRNLLYLIQEFKGLKMLIALQIIVCFVVVFRFACSRSRSRRRSLIKESTTRLLI